MKGLGANRSRHLSDSCDAPSAPPEPMYSLAPDPHAFLLSPTLNHYGTMDPHLHHFAVATPSALPPECLLPLNNQLSNSSTFPRLHYTSHTEQSDLTECCVAQAGSVSGTLSSSVSVGLGLGSSSNMITSGTATISSAAAAKMNRLPANLLEQLERHLPMPRDGFSTLQFHRRSRGSRQRSESPSRIRNLVQSVQKLFAKSQSLEVSALKGGVATGPGGERRSKSKDRAKTEGARRRPRPNLSGFWSSDDALEDEPPAPATYRSPLTMMTLGRAVSDSQAPPKTLPQGYNTIAAHSLKSSRSSGDLKPPAGPAPGPAHHAALVKRGSWSTLTLTQARQVLQKGSATVNRSLLKSKSCHGQETSCNFLQVPGGDWSGTLGKAGEIPCRRMRSGSYVKAMGDEEESEDSDGPPSPKPSPKSAARRQSYLKATQRSLSEHQPPVPPRNCLPSLCEVSTNRSLDCLVGGDTAGQQTWSAEAGFTQGCVTLGRASIINQVEQGFLGNVAFRQAESQAVEALDLPTPTCFRSRSHSYLRAIQAGCSQDEDTPSVDSDDTPPATPPISSYSSISAAALKKNPPPIPPRIISKPFISVTLQSSTESAQDTYLDSQEQRSEANSQSGRSNSSDSLASSRTGSLVKGARRPPIPAPREPVHLPSARVTTPPPAFAPPPPVSLAVGTEEPLALPKRKLSSIGIQVDCVQPVLKEEHTPTTRFQSIGVQVEDGRPLSRFTSMASRQETTEAESQDPSEGKAATPSRAHKPPRATPSLQEKLDPALDPSSLPPPDPSLEPCAASLNGGAEQPGGSALLRDGRWFQKLLEAESERMEAWCQQMDQETKEQALSEEVLGKVRSAVGSAQLLMSQKFQQFRGLCEQNLDAEAQPRPTPQDLAGFWDLLQLSIEDISMKFDELHLLRSNHWATPEQQDTKAEKSAQAHTPKKTVKVKPSAAKEKSSDSAADKQRQEARKRLMAAKRAVSERQNSATESAESIEIYVPEAQTRL